MFLLFQGGFLHVTGERGEGESRSAAASAQLSALPGSAEECLTLFLTRTSYTLHFLELG